jgi:glycine/D-amino acid oxidase-like deaminating enzyme
MEVDYLIVGAGLAGVHFSYQCLLNQKKFHVIDGHLESSSRIAAGLYNPVILKRFTQAWHAEQQLAIFDDIYNSLGSILYSDYDFKLPILRKFASIEEQNLWFEASDQSLLSSYLDTTLIFSEIRGIQSLFGFGKVNQTGYVDTKKLITDFQEYLRSISCFSENIFNYDAIHFEDNHINYDGIKSKNIVFAEGFGMIKNPFFNLLPLDGSKGEILIIECIGLVLDVIIKGGVFIIPLGNHLFKVGSTYHWHDKTSLPTEEAKLELITQLDSILKLPYKVVSHTAGVRPTVKDRKPLLGSHPNHRNLHVLNGLGTRGVMLAPYLAKMLFDYIEFQTPLHQEVDIKRFRKIHWDL